MTVLRTKCRFIQVFFVLLLLIFLQSCRQKKAPIGVWGSTSSSQSSTSGGTLQLNDIIANGELIMVTFSGPETYYDYHGHGMGLHYLMCEKFCKQIGVSLRVDVCKDTLDMIQRVRNGEADVIAMPLKIKESGLTTCLENTSNKKWHWLVNQDNKTLADSLNKYLTVKVMEEVKSEQDFLLSSASVKRHVYSPMMNRAKGVISQYDNLFQKYAPTARWDWRLLAAQCYQESTFDPKAHSWAGACGLMQIMPSTAGHLGLPQSSIYDPERNVEAASRYIAELTQRFTDVTNQAERIKFVLASYNGGSNHVRDAMALARKHGRSPYRWSDVQVYILKLMEPAYYNDPLVKSGYMRGSETANYVDKIWARWMEYRGVKGISASSASSAPTVIMPEPVNTQPHPSAKRKDKYNL